MTNAPDHDAIFALVGGENPEAAREAGLLETSKRTNFPISPFVLFNPEAIPGDKAVVDMKRTSLF